MRRRQHALLAAAIFGLALAVRLLFLGAAIDRHWPHSAYYEGDAILWAQGAETLQRGASADDPLFFRSNALAHVLKVLPAPARDYLRPKILWCVASALTCAAIYLFCVVTGLHLGTALAAAGLAVFSFDADLLATSLNTEAPYTLVLALVLIGSWRFACRPTLGAAVTLGALHGVAIWLRIEHVLFLALTSSVLIFVSPIRWSRRVALLGAVVLAAGLVCLPSTLESTRAATAYNTLARREPSYDRMPVDFTPDARAFIETLPAFARHRAAQQLSELAAHRGVGSLGAAAARQLLRDEFGYVPEPLSTPVFVSGQGPLNFALANHPDAHGAFSKAALQNRFTSDDPRLTLSLPPHLLLYNHGYAAGWRYIRGDPRSWLTAVGRKLWFFVQGATSGLTAYNLPLGRFGERRPCDLLTPFPGHGIVWSLVFGGLLIAGAVLARRSAAGRWCLLVVVYKLIVTVAFFGYARQAASILPATAVLVALALHALTARFIRPRAGRIAAAAIAALGVGIEIHAALHPPAFDIKGPLRATPEWGESAFSANAHIQLFPQAE
jgi:hypothetical protein